MFIEGLRFGLILQFAVGPICLMVFNAAGAGGFFAGSLAALAVTLVDGLYILLAALGISAFLRNGRIKKALQFAGSGVLILFGLDIAAGALGFPLLPQAAPSGGGSVESAFLRAALMTASNPLTIVFWGGVFSSRAASENMRAAQLFPFGAGCASATLAFLNGAALAGSAVNTFLPPGVMTALNVCVGAGVIFFALKMAGLVKI